MKKAMIARRALLGAWQVVYAAVDRRATLAVLSGVLLEADATTQTLRLTATDLTIALRAEVQASVEDGFSAVLPAWEFLLWLKALAEGAVTLSVSEADGRVAAVCGPSRGRFAFIEAEMFPLVDWTLNGLAVSVSGDTFRRMARDVAMAASENDARPVLAGIFLHRDESGRLVAVASDGYRLAVLSSEVEAPEGFEAVVPAEALRKAAPLVAADDVTLALDGTSMRIALGGGVMMQTQLVDGVYPPYTRVMPQRFASVLRVQRQALARALREMEIFAMSSRVVALRWTAESVQLSAASAELGRGETAAPATLEGEPLDIGFNISYLQAAVDAVRGDEVVMRGNTPDGAVVVQGVGDESFVCVMMPMALER